MPTTGPTGQFQLRANLLHWSNIIIELREHLQKIAVHAPVTDFSKVVAECARESDIARFFVHVKCLSETIRPVEAERLGKGPPEIFGKYVLF